MELVGHSIGNAHMMNVELKKRTEMHWARKVWHMVGVSLLAWVFFYFSSFWSGVIFSVIWLAAVPFDFFRLKSPKVNDLFTHVFKSIMRQSEAQHLAGSTYLFSGVLLIYFIFPRDVVMISLLYLAFADPLASVFGIRFGKDKIFGQKKSVQGSLAAFFVCSVITFFVLSSKGLMMDRIVLVSILGGFIGAAAEAVPLGKMDDNFSIPVISAIGLWFLFTIFGGFSSYPVF